MQALAETETQFLVVLVQLSFSTQASAECPLRCVDARLIEKQEPLTWYLRIRCSHRWRVYSPKHWPGRTRPASRIQAQGLSTSYSHQHVLPCGTLELLQDWKYWCA